MTKFFDSIDNSPLNKKQQDEIAELIRWIGNALFKEKIGYIHNHRLDGYYGAAYYNLVRLGVDVSELSVPVKREEDL